MSSHFLGTDEKNRLILLLPDLATVIAKNPESDNICIFAEENKALYKNYQILKILYESLCKAQQDNPDAFIKEILLIAVYLYYIHSKLLNAWQGEEKYRLEIDAFNAKHGVKNNLALIFNEENEASITVPELKARPFFEKYFSATYFRKVIFVRGNWLRLFIVRWDRFFIDLALLTNNSGILAVSHILHKVSVEWLLLPILSFVFYVPRLLINFYIIAKHVIPNNGMSREEKSLGWSLRLKTHWERRCFQIINDAGWFGIDLIVYLSVRSVGMTLIGLLYFFDVINMALDIWALRKITGSLEQRVAKAGADIPEAYAVAIKCHTDQCMREKWFNFSMTSLLFVAMIPVVSFMPQLPFLLLTGATLVLLTASAQPTLQHKFTPKIVTMASLYPAQESLSVSSSSASLASKTTSSSEGNYRRVPVGT